MDQPETKPAARSTFLVDTVLTAGAFAFFTWILSGHVPSRNPFDIWLWGAVSAACMAAVFWLALQMFRAVWRAQHSSEKE